MRYIIWFLLLLSLASCSLPWQSHDFSSVVARHTEAQYDLLDQLIEHTGLRESREESGKISSRIALPSLLSGSVDLDYALGYQSLGIGQFLIPTLQLAYDQVGGGSGDLSIASMQWRNISGESFFSVGGMSGSLVDAHLASVMQKYYGKWIDLTELTSGSGLSDRDRMVANFSRNIEIITIADMRSYSEKYPLWKLVRDNGLIDGYYSYEVELDREHMISWISELSTRLTGEAIKPEDITSLRQALEKVELAGTLRIDRDHELYSSFRGTLGTQGWVEKVGITASHTKQGISFSLENSGQSIAWELSYAEAEKKWGLTLSASASGAEVGRLDGSLSETNTGRELLLTITSNGQKISLTHSWTPDSFLGNISAFFGNIEWKGTSRDNQLTNLSLSGSSLGGVIRGDLVESGSMIRGPLELSFDDRVIMRSDLALESRPWVFGLIADIHSPTLSGAVNHVEWHMTHTTTHPRLQIERPSESILYSTVADELDASFPQAPEIEKSTPIETLLDSSATGADEKDPR